MCNAYIITYCAILIIKGINLSTYIIYNIFINIGSQLKDKQTYKMGNLQSWTNIAQIN